MNKNLKIAGYGFFVWLIPSLITVTLTFFSDALNIFEIISAVAIALTVIMFSFLYFNDINAGFVKEGVLIGLVWLIISIVMDLILVLIGISQLSLTSYITYVAPLYVLIPAITIGLGLYMDQRK